ncbi:hypothetical protein EDC01DRAFT_661482 [Geopyxis carbonaria]|nr:hypothetical protein EDC01DRAFT_661482 [Geopyxis carbonaria]
MSYYHRASPQAAYSATSSDRSDYNSDVDMEWTPTNTQQQFWDYHTGGSDPRPSSPQPDPTYPVSPSSMRINRTVAITVEVSPKQTRYLPSGLGIQGAEHRYPGMSTSCYSDSSSRVNADTIPQLLQPPLSAVGSPAPEHSPTYEHTPHMQQQQWELHHVDAEPEHYRRGSRHQTAQRSHDTGARSARGRSRRPRPRPSDGYQQHQNSYIGEAPEPVRRYRHQPTAYSATPSSSSSSVDDYLDSYHRVPGRRDVERGDDYLLRRFLAVDTTNDPVVYEARRAVREGRVREGDVPSVQYHWR